MIISKCSLQHDWRINRWSFRTPQIFSEAYCLRVFREATLIQRRKQRFHLSLFISGRITRRELIYIVRQCYTAGIICHAQCYVVQLLS